jgi:hypothetical protein
MRPSRSSAIRDIQSHTRLPDVGVPPYIEEPPSAPQPVLPSGDSESGGREKERAAADQSAHALPMQAAGRGGPGGAHAPRPRRAWCLSVAERAHPRASGSRPAQRQQAAGNAGGALADEVKARSDGQHGADASPLRAAEHLGGELWCQRGSHRRRTRRAPSHARDRTGVATCRSAAPVSVALRHYLSLAHPGACRAGRRAG